MCVIAASAPSWADDASRTSNPQQLADDRSEGLGDSLISAAPPNHGDAARTNQPSVGASQSALTADEAPTDRAPINFAAPPKDRVGALLTGFDQPARSSALMATAPFSKPTQQYLVTSGYGPRGRSFHRGIDLDGEHGDPILASAAGKVIYVGWRRGFGKVIKISHAFGVTTLYAHLSKFRVSVGEMVAQGDRIGDMGRTGRATGTHLHYEIHVNGRAVNPKRFIRAGRYVLEKQGKRSNRTEG